MCKEGGASLTVVGATACYMHGPFPSLLVSTTVARPVYSSVLNWIVTEEMVEQLAKNINTAAVFLEMEPGRSRLMVES